MYFFVNNLKMVANIRTESYYAVGLIYNLQAKMYDLRN